MSANSCGFDLCSDCARKNNEAGRKNECSSGHQLSLISVNTPGWQWEWWRCNGEECFYRWSPEQEQDQDVVWRCQHDKRKFLDCPYTGTPVINKVPWDDGKIEKPEETETFSEAENKREDGETEMVEEIRPTRACAGEAGDTQEEQQPRSPTLCQCRREF